MPQPPRLLRIATPLLVCALLSVAVLAPPAAANTSLNTAVESPIAVPFIGDYEVWCTDRNPAPGNRCRSHHGSPAIDIGMDPGTPLYAAGDGTVIDADNHCPARGSCNNGKGNAVIIEHADGTFSRYLHMAAVAVVDDQVVRVGQQIGTAGESGQSSSPHLHYDEHFPFGTRTDMGQWIGCVGGEQVRYPDVFGTSDWNEVPYGSRIVNDGYDCLEGVELGLPQTDPPRIIPGTSHFGITAPTDITRKVFQVSIDRNDGAAPEVLSVSGTTLIYRSTPQATISVRTRELKAGVWHPWSASVDYAGGDSLGVPTCAGLFATTASMTGTPDVDVIVGTDASDEINARGGDDVICGNGGDDSILAGIGKDRVFGGPGNDRISGGRGFDQIRGQAGNDTILGGDGRDTIIGGDGDDSLAGNTGNDNVQGGAGNDDLIGGIGHDTLLGGSGGDSLDGRNGRDVLLAGNGDDVLDGGNGRDRIVGGAGADSIVGGPGSDRCVSDTNDLQQMDCER